MRTGLATSTVTPGRTAPDVSLTRPLMALCAKATAGRNRNTQQIQKRTRWCTLLLISSLSERSLCEMENEEFRERNIRFNGASRPRAPYPRHHPDSDDDHPRPWTANGGD